VSLNMEKYTTVYLEVTWSSGDSEKLTLLDGTKLDDVVSTLDDINSEEFFGLIQWDTSVVCLRLDLIRKIKLWTEERYR